MPRAYDNRQSTGGQAIPRASENRPYSGAQVTPRTSDSRQYSGTQAAPRSDAGRLYSAAPPPANMERPNQAQPRAEQRTYGQGANQAQPRARAVTPEQYRGQAQLRNEQRPPNGGSRAYGGYARPNYGRDNYYYARPYHSQVYARPRHYAPYRPYHFGHNYYSFRPYWNLGFGLWVGYSVPYPYTYFYAGYAPRVYGSYYSSATYYSGGDYYGVGSYMATPAVSVYGGVSFDIQPSDADLFIDGEYVGTVGTFSPTGEPLTLTPGEHRIAIQRNGFRPMEWDVTIEPGQVIPYRGVMEKL
jgi:hypothetical protein